MRATIAICLICWFAVTPSNWHAGMLITCCICDRRPVALPRVLPVGGSLPVHRVASESAMSQ